MADGTPRVILDLDCTLEKAAPFLSPGATLAIARLEAEAASSSMVGEQNNRIFGEYAKELKLSGFFRNPKVWPHIGSDANFLNYLRNRPFCVVCRRDAKEENPIEAAHVRSVASGAGVGIKPAYSAIPACKECHSTQHNHGNQTMTGDGDSYEARDTLARHRIEALESWGWVTLKKNLGYQSWAEIDPKVMCAWAYCRDLLDAIPIGYREAGGYAE